MLLPSTTLLLTLLSFVSLLVTPASGAFTTPVTRDGDFVERNAIGQFCYFPTALNPATIDVACLGPVKGDYAQVMAAHFNTSTSINYFSASFERLGGPEWPVASNTTSIPGGGNDVVTGRKIYLCLSGRAGDYTYQTMCTTVGRDNSLGNNGPSPYCKIQGGQDRVTDGCYVPNQPIPNFTLGAIGEMSRTRPAIVTITRERPDGSTTAGVVRSGAPVVDSQLEEDVSFATTNVPAFGLLATLTLLCIAAAIGV